MKNFSRRNFCKTLTTFSSSMLILPSWAKSSKGKPSERLRIAIIGTGGRGEVAVETFGGIGLAQFSKANRKVLGNAIFKPLPNCPPCELVAFCDVDWDFASASFRAFPKIPKYKDYRKMFDEMSDKIDAVVVAVPDHMHYPITARAILEGKHVFCEKPLSRTFWEADEMTRLAQKAGVITQMGNQGATSDSWRRLREWLDAGIIGKITQVHCMTPCPIWPQGNLAVPNASKIPTSLDYNLWLGVAPDMPYSPNVVPFNWRGLRNYGVGAIGDMGCHIIEPIFNAINLPLPRKLKATCDKATLNDYTWASSNQIDFEFETPYARDGIMKMRWYDGGRMPDSIKDVDMETLIARNFADRRPRNILLVEGETGAVQVGLYGSAMKIFPRQKMIELKKAKAFPPPKIERSAYPSNPHFEFAWACLGKCKTSSPFTSASRLAQVCHLGSLSTLFSGEELHFDTKKKSFGFNEVDKHLHSQYEYKKEFLPV